MRVESYTISLTPSLVATAKRYRSSTRRIHAGTPGWVLIFAHGAGLYKEYFEPLLKRLFELDDAKDCAGQIVEAWAIDAASHGAAAELNDGDISKDTFKHTPVDYAGAISALRTSIFFGDPELQRVVLIGDREGAAAALFTPDYFSPDEPLPIEHIVLLDPFLSSPVNTSEEWPNRDAARKHFARVFSPDHLENFLKNALVRTETGSIKSHASLRSQEQLRDRKYRDWSSMVIPLNVGSHLLVHSKPLDEEIAQFRQPLTSVTVNPNTADAIYNILTDASHDIAERVFTAKNRFENKL
ncbi:hypothetical protein CYLTODRAFT_421928 [Cylindrobasidium torrendii FP15055 ss-10]|uniref:Uncharacterized protein n=1 Tax=Cylindrobasidium torrendii FP15055 ss-10 TaxID=1314674 RepID=A0A0D7BD30_9AGAR|nr:hypothetical protein CYLTODRAFT_421928 [Cylindrobasidium torrendii FP15055 ss-10]